MSVRQRQEIQTVSRKGIIGVPLRIVYMGTPEFAVAGLRALVEHGREIGCEVVAVVTMPDKPAGRGHKLQFSPVKEYALEVGLPILQPEKLKDETFVEALRSYKADLQVVTAFRMLPEVVWAMPRLGTFNVHASLLPQYRGAAPINWAVINGDKQTGLTSFLLKHEIDTGNILLQETMPIGEEDTVGDVHDRLMDASAGFTLRTAELIAKCDREGVPVPATPQPERGELLPAPKIFKETCEIDFTRKAEEIRNFVRGLSPYPAAWCNLQLGETTYENVKVYRVAVSEQGPRHGHIIVSCQDGYVELLELQLPGKKRMDSKSLLNGLRTD